ncbi:hypothetical protein SpCBS45565_g06300 [Spizellomyces sp. 'palustris']|nr:hypothetical protein SpCBS45565_g06300 [Spizellomyces sp. 'palustris']
MSPYRATTPETDSDVEYPLLEQLNLRMTAESEQDDDDDTETVNSCSDGGLWMRERPKEFHVVWTRRVFVKVLFEQEEIFARFSEFCKFDTTTYHALRFHSAYTHVLRHLTERLPPSYRLSLSHATFAISRFLSPDAPPAPSLSFPSKFVPHIHKLWATYVAHSWDDTHLGMWIPGHVRMNIAIGMSKEKIWCGILDECVAWVLEAIFMGAFRRFVGGGWLYNGAVLDASKYPSPPASPAGSSGSTTCYSMRSSTSSSLIAPCISVRTSSLRPPPSWSRQLSALSKDSEQRDSGVSVKTNGRVKGDGASLYSQLESLDRYPNCTWGTRGSRK